MPLRCVIQFSSVYLAVFCLCSTQVFAQQIPNVDLQTQQMALEMDTADCDTLLALPTDTKRLFLLTAMYLQRKGSLSRIVGPDCAFLGSNTKVAAIDDTSLTVGSNREILYYLPDFNALIVSHTSENAVAYGMFIDEDSTADPLTYFLAHRTDAEGAATLAKSFHNTVGMLEPPTYTATSSSSTAPSVYVAPQSSSAAAVTHTSSSSTQQVPHTTPQSVTTLPSTIRTTSLPPTPTPVQQARSSVQTVLTPVPEEPSDTLPTVQPVGPQQQPLPVQSGRSGSYWALMAFLAIVVIGVGIVILKTRVSKKQGLLNT